MSAHDYYSGRPVALAVKSAASDVLADRIRQFDDDLGQAMRSDDTPDERQGHISEFQARMGDLIGEMRGLSKQECLEVAEAIGLSGDTKPAIVDALERRWQGDIRSYARTPRGGV